MMKTVHKWFWAWDFEKEEKWLNEMSAIGLHLVGVGFAKYFFEEGAPGEYTVRLQMLEQWPSSAQSAQYIKFIEETGAEHVGTFARWAYFRKKTAESEDFELFSDIDSRIRHISRLLLMFCLLAIAQLTILFSNTMQYIESPGGSPWLRIAPLVFTSLLMIFAAFRFWRILRRLKKERSVRE